jgi:hypothetical protein
VSGAGGLLGLHAFLRASAATGRTVISSPPFAAYLHPEDPLRFLNYAIPDSGARPTEEQVERLRAVFARARRRTRLEWIEEVAPELAPRLAAAGLEEELRTPLMTCTPDRLLDAGADVPQLAVGPVDDAGLEGAANVQRVAFGLAPLEPGERPDDQRRSGGGAVLARSGPTPVAAASWTRVIEGVSEVAGVATAEAWRRRGLAGATTAAAARAAFAAGARLCVISPGDVGAERVYARAGFARVATMLHWVEPE